MKTPPKHNDQAIRNQYAEHGVAPFYAEHGADYRNPHESIIAELLSAAVAAWQLELRAVLDLACGSGEATLALRSLGATQIDGIDPYTTEAYQLRTGQTAEAFTFEQIAEGALGRRVYSLIVCSFALHLLDPSWLPALLAQLQRSAPRLLILTPHKRPELKPTWGWRLLGELQHKRVRARLYERTAEEE